MILYISRKSNLLQASIGRFSILQLFQLFTCRAVTSPCKNLHTSWPVHVIAIGFSDFLSDSLICRRPGFWMNIPAVNQFNAYACCECRQKVCALWYAFKFVLRDRFAQIFFPKLLMSERLHQSAWSFSGDESESELIGLCAQQPAFMQYNIRLSVRFTDPSSALDGRGTRVHAKFLLKSLIAILEKEN